MIHITDKTECCGCSACVQICGHNAICMKTDDLGFSYPYVNKEKCIDCGLCEKICPILNDNVERIPTRVFAVKNKDLSVRLASSSGGLFSIIAENVLREGGIVYGAAFNEEWDVEHIRITKSEDLSKLRGSKYVQSSIGNIYKEVQKDLRDNKKVLFSGCPCQIAGLKSFLRKNHPNLITVDFVCHGVPNPRIWKEFLLEERFNLHKHFGEKRLKSSREKLTINKISFRDKENGWERFNFVMQMKKQKNGEDNYVIQTNSTYVWEHPYMLMFLKDYILRPSCHNCHFRKGKGGSTYTIGDYWGISRFYPEFDDDKGTSLLMQYDTDKANWLENTDYLESSYTEATWGNPAIYMSWPTCPESKIFYFLHDKFHLNLINTLNICLKLTDSRLKLKKVKQKCYFLIVKIIKTVLGETLTNKIKSIRK